MVNWEIKRDKNGFIDMEFFRSRHDAEQYEACVLIPGVWKAQAATLLHAADKLFQVYDAAETREKVRDLAEYEYTKQTGNNYQMDNKERVDWSNDYDDSRLLQVFLLLVGYAIENLIKGILYGKHPTKLEESDETLKLALKCHNLSELYRIAMDLEKLTEIEPCAREILDWLTQYILWRGRYAIPVDLKQFSSLPEKPPLCLNYSDRTNLNIGRLNLLIEQLVNELDNVPVPPTHLDGRK
jgi:hypothetical protein